MRDGEQPHRRGTHGADHQDLGPRTGDPDGQGVGRPDSNEGGHPGDYRVSQADSCRAGADEILDLRQGSPDLGLSGQAAVTCNKRRVSQRPGFDRPCQVMVQPAGLTGRVSSG